MSDYHWYPGHMTKARRQMQEDMKLVDLVIELLDARIPFSSRNPDIDAMAKGKSRIVLLGKADLADDKVTTAWLEYFKEKGIHALKLDSRNRSGVKRIDPIVQKACSEKLERDRKRGIIGRPVRAMVAGIPNAGKSTFINSFAGKACAKTGNKPGVTKGKQWIKLSKTLELLDTPGILWPRFDDPVVGRNIAFIGSMNDTVLQTGELAAELIGFLEEAYPGAIGSCYGFDTAEAASQSITREAGILEAIALSRRALAKGGGADTEKAASIILDDFRSGKLGRLSVEKPDSLNFNS